MTSQTAIGFVSRKRIGNLRPFAHGVGSHHQDGGEHRERDVTRQRSGERYDQQQRGGVDQTRDRRGRAGSNIGRGARDRPGGRQPSEQRRGDVREPLRHQFDVGVVPVAAHAVGDHRRHQRFDGAEHRHGDGGHDQPAQQLGTECGQVERRQAARNPAKAAPDGLDRPAEQRDRTGSQEQRHDRAGHPPRHPRHQQDHDQRAEAEGGRGWRPGRQMRRQRQQARQEVARCGGDPRANECAAACCNQDRDAVGEAEDRTRDEPHRGAHSGQAQHDEQPSGHQGAHEQAVDSEARHDAGHDHHERAGRAANLHARTAERRDDGAGHDGGVDAGLRRQPGGDRERHRERKGDQADGHTSDEVAGGLAAIVMGQPAQPGSDRVAEPPASRSAMGPSI